MDKILLDERYTNIYEFAKKLPKVELHAHLNGSLSRSTLEELVELQRTREADLPLLDPYTVTDSGEWSRLTVSFGLAQRLTGTAAAVTLATQRTVHEFASDGCVYLELRSTPRPVPTLRDYIEAVLDGIENSCNSSIRATYIVSVDRSWSADRAEEVVELAIEYHARSPDRLVGVDLSGDPSAGCFDTFRPALTRARHAGLKISLHCGEVENAAEVAAMLEFAPERLGHAVCVCRGSPGGSEHLETLLRLSPCAVEVCLTSNVVTGHVRDYADHHIIRLHQIRVPFVICTDDCGVFGTSSSKEHALAAYTLTSCGGGATEARAILGALAERAAQRAFASGSVQSELLEKIRLFHKQNGLL